MARSAGLRAAAALFLVCVFTLVAGKAGPRRPAHLDGYVYEKCVDFTLVGPVRGAVVSTSVDRTTASTDAGGHFHLVTRNPVFSDEYHEVAVRAGDALVDDHLTLTNRSLVQLAFVLSPPERLFVVRDGKSGQMSCHSFPFRTVARRGK